MQSFYKPLIIQIIILFSIFSKTAKSELQEVTLKEAFRSALQKTETPFIGQARVNQADARLSQAKSSFYPDISFGASYNKEDSSGGSSFFDNGDSYTRLSLSQSLYEGGRDLSILRTNQAQKEYYQQSMILENYNLFTSVARAFYGLLSNEREVENLKRTTELAKDRIKVIGGRAKIGRSRNIELTAAQSQLAVLEAQLMAAEGQLITAWDQFILLTALPRDMKLVHRKEKPDQPEKLENYLEFLEKRPDIVALKAQINNAQYQIDTAKAGHLPNLSLNGNYYLSGDGPQREDDWNVGINLTFPLFAGGEVKAEVREASEKSMEAQLLLNQARRQAEIIIRTDYNNLVSAINQISALETALKFTEQNYREQEKNYRFGQATNLDVIQALNTFQDTKRTLDRTRYIAFSAWADLKAATAQVSLANGSEGENI